jgi:hypothetical protein
VARFDGDGDTVATCDIGAFEFNAEPPTAFEVDSAADAVDALIGDGFCATSVGECTLRAAVQEANAWGTPVLITFAPALDGVPITLLLGPFQEDSAAGGDLDIADGSEITIRGNGPANTVIQACTVPQLEDTCANEGGQGVVDRVLHVLEGGELTLEDVTVQHGRPQRVDPVLGTVHIVGGGILADGRLNVSRSLIISNRGTSAIRAEDSLTIIDSMVRDNASPGIEVVGGDLLVIGSTVDGNRGRGISAGGDAVVTIVNSTISGNEFGGVGVAGADVSLVNVTVTGNSDSFGGGIRVASEGSVTLTNSVVAGNMSLTADPDCRVTSGTITSGGHNLIGITGGFCTVTPTTGDQFGTAEAPIDPRLGPLQDNGGPTFTHSLLFDSPARGAGHYTTYTDPDTIAGVDQRGVSRLDDLEVCDNGAYEFVLSDDATLADLQVGATTLLPFPLPLPLPVPLLVPPFDPGTTAYTVTVPNFVFGVVITPTASHPGRHHRGGRRPGGQRQPERPDRPRGGRHRDRGGSDRRGRHDRARLHGHGHPRRAGARAGPPTAARRPDLDALADAGAVPNGLAIANSGARGGGLHPRRQRAALGWRLRHLCLLRRHLRGAAGGFGLPLRDGGLLLQQAGRRLGGVGPGLGSADRERRVPRDLLGQPADPRGDDFHGSLRVSGG